MDNEIVAEEIVETRELWKVQFRQDKSHPWTDVGTDRADLPATIRVYDYWLKNHADVEVQMLRTIVTVEVADVARLKKTLNLTDDTTEERDLHS